MIARARLAYRNYLLAMLLVIFALNQVDRFALGLVLQDMKLDLALSDTQIGLLGGIAFAFFYSVMGIPIARWADRGNRVTIIAITTGLWSVATAVCGLAGNFVEMLAARVAAAVGEAGCVPLAHSLIAEYFTRAERPRAVGRYMLGIPLSIFVGYFVAGWLNEFHGWRLTFVVLGLPGLLVAALARFTLEEPRLGAGANKERSAQPGLRQVWRTLSGNATFRQLLIFFTIATFLGTAISQWQPAFFVRSYGLKTGELGTWLAAIYVGGGLVGSYVGGEWASRTAAGNEPLQLKAMAAVCVVFGIITAGMFLSSNKFLTLGFKTFAVVTFYTLLGPLLAMVQTLVPDHIRATSVALFYLCANLVGVGLGPLLVGALSDLFMPVLDADSLRYALLAICPAYLWGAFHLRRAARTVNRDLEAANRENR